MGRLRRYVKWIWVGTLYVTGLLWWAKRRIAGSQGVVVLAFHRVLEDAQFRETSSPDGMLVRARTFEKLARCIGKSYRVLDLGTGKVIGKAGSAPTLALTFDDGWSDNRQVALPILKECGLPITIFLCPGMIGRAQPFWPERLVASWKAAAGAAEARSAVVRIFPPHIQDRLRIPAQSNSPEIIEGLLRYLKELPVGHRDRILAEMEQTLHRHNLPLPVSACDTLLSPEDVTAMLADGIVFGSHTVNHEILTHIPPPDAERELRLSRNQVTEQTGEDCDLFAYPNGNYSAEVRQLVAGAGYRHAFILKPGVWTSDTDPFLVPRINIWQGKLCDPSGRFSRMMFDYSVFWTAAKAPHSPTSTACKIEAHSLA